MNVKPLHFEDWETVLKETVPPELYRKYRESIVKFRYWLRQTNRQPDVEIFKAHLEWKQWEQLAVGSLQWAGLAADRGTPTGCILYHCADQFANLGRLSEQRLMPCTINEWKGTGNGACQPLSRALS